MSTITHTYSYDFRPCAETRYSHKATPVVQLPIGTREEPGPAMSQIVQINGPLPLDFKDAYNAVRMMSVETRNLYELNGMIPPKLIHDVERKEGSIFGEADHIIIHWEGPTHEGVIAVCDDVFLPNNCVVETVYEASFEELEDVMPRLTTEEFKSMPDTNHRYNGISIPGIEKASAVCGNVIPIELAYSIDISMSLGSSPYLARIFPETKITNFNRSIIPFLLQDYPCPDVFLNERFNEITISEGSDTWIHFISRKDISAALFSSLKSRPTDFYSGMLWSLQMH